MKGEDMRVIGTDKNGDEIAGEMKAGGENEID
jgi:hypothetical protein